jgi:ribosomal-protein-alanine N-acetyltransferase
MDVKSLNELKTGNLTLRKINLQDKDFISELFKDEEILKFYIVPEEIDGQHSKLLDYWLDDSATGSGFAWIITEYKNGLFSSRQEKCGFIAFEFRASLTNARISYALEKSKRGKGIISNSIELVLDNLKRLGIETVEADIDKENIASEKLVVKLGFTTDKSKALMDPKLAAQGIFRARHLWTKRLKELSPEAKQVGRIGIAATKEELVTELNHAIEKIKTNGEHPDLVARYLFLHGRINFLDGKFNEARSAFGQCNMIKMNHETFYWFSRIDQLESDKSDAGLYYLKTALEYYQDNPSLISKAELLKALEKYNQ